MNIKVLGPGCPNCKELERRVEQAVCELGLNASIEKVTDWKDISRYIMTTPGIVIEGKVVHSGKPLPRKEQIVKWLKEASK